MPSLLALNYYVICTVTTRIALRVSSVNYLLLNITLSLLKLNPIGHLLSIYILFSLALWVFAP